MSQLHTPADWDRYRLLLTSLYVERGMIQKDIVAYMRTQHSFHATQTMYTKRFMKWNINKKIRAKDARAVQDAFDQQAQSGRTSPIPRDRGQSIPYEKFQRYLKRRKRYGHGVVHSPQARQIEPGFIVGEVDNALDCAEPDHPPASEERFCRTINIRTTTRRD